MTDNEMILKLLTARTALMNELKKTTTIEEMTQRYLIRKVAGQYKQVVKNANIDPNITVIWGKGGAQSAKLAKCIKNNTKYLHIVDTYT